MARMELSMSAQGDSLNCLAKVGGCEMELVGHTYCSYEYMYLMLSVHHDQMRLRCACVHVVSVLLARCGTRGAQYGYDHRSSKQGERDHGSCVQAC